ncbi:WAT1-related protein At4g30420 isoform X1 [Beta vulgaris subsp. vulgaris]|uniref:WAT1-related protein At4g30420 isoform X1 n=1 Tax=Beta vulgaris subsp. vulgaris TaxID=3555 RepID=UPI002036944C|nr:WAT1-related protein At4g30420 isoform X1 [Beta vulgaris subsp. vulgaris]
MGAWEHHLPAIAMVLMQVLYAAMALLNRAALVKGMSPRVFIFYRQTIATLVISPIAYLIRGRSNTAGMGFRSFLLIFVTAFIGVALNQNMYFEGLYLASSSIASATSNMIPAVTFLIAVAMGLEQVQTKTLSSAAKILGTAFCVGGAISMALLRGPKLLNAQLEQPNSLFQHLLGVDNTWLLGCLCLFASSCCWSLWLILQVPVTARYPDHLCLSAWTCFISMLQTGAIALFFERDPVAWNLSSNLELTCCFFSGILGSGVQFFIQSWCISLTGPFYAAMFTPLATVITTVLACIFLHEELYVGSLLGAVAVIIGLYVVLWGKSKELKSKLDPISGIGPIKIAQEKCDKIDLEQPLLIDDTNTPQKNEAS